MSPFTSLPDLNRDARKRLVPVGGVILWWGTAAPDGYLLCDGTVYSSVSYPKLALTQGVTTGTFTVPNITAPVGSGCLYVIKY